MKEIKVDRKNEGKEPSKPIEFLYAPDTSGKCPYCLYIVRFHTPILDTGGSVRPLTAPPPPTYLYVSGGNVSIEVYSSQCPNCKRPIISATIESEGKKVNHLVIPPNINRIAPSEVPSAIKEDFLEASNVMHESEKASAALSRRCLQNLLNDNGIKERDLNAQIDNVIKQLPKRLADNVDAIRNICNFAAHPIKYQTTGLIVDVEPEEANWNLDVLEGLFEYYYVQPKRAEEQRKKLNEKLASIGKPQMKKS